MRSYLRLVLLASLCVPMALWAQISFTSNDIPCNPGTEIDLESSDPLWYIPLDPGPAGANQNWDFTSVDVDIEFTQNWIEAATAPGHGYFPNANRCMQNEDSYEYWNLSSTGLLWLGLYDDGSGDTTLYYGGDPFWAFPCTYGDTWTTTFTAYPNPALEIEFELEYEVDGWGTVTDMMGTFDCLRLKGYYTITTTTQFGSFEMTQWVYHWLVPDMGDIVFMESEPDVIDPDFYFRRMTSISSGVRPVNLGSALPTQVTLLPAYPNPFNPGTQLSFSLPKPGDVTLAVYNLQGQAVAQVVKGWYAPGIYNAVFDASALTSGIYLARLQANGLTATQKLTLMK